MRDVDKEVVIVGNSVRFVSIVMKIFGVVRNSLMIVVLKMFSKMYIKLLNIGV